MHYGPLLDESSLDKISIREDAVELELSLYENVRRR